MANLIGEIETIERTIVTAIVNTFLSVDIINDHVNVYDYERIPGSDEEDEDISTIPDPNNPNNLDLRLTSILQIGVPRIGESEYTGDRSTSLVLEYPITFDFSAVDRWDVSDPLNPWRYPNSSQFVKSVYLRARQAFKATRTFGYENVVHNYLQLVDSVLVTDEEVKAVLHSSEMSLTVILSGVIV